MSELWGCSITCPLPFKCTSNVNTDCLIKWAFPFRTAATRLLPRGRLRVRFVIARQTQTQDEHSMPDHVLAVAAVKHAAMTWRRKPSGLRTSYLELVRKSNAKTFKPLSAMQRDMPPRPAKYSTKSNKSSGGTSLRTRTVMYTSLQKTLSNE